MAQHKLLLATCIGTLILVGQNAFAQQVEAFPSPSGIVVNYVKCSAKSSKCMKKAAAFCEGSYQVIDSESHSGGLIADILPGPVKWFSLTFLCGKSDGKMPDFPFTGPQQTMPSFEIPSSVQTTCSTFGNTTRCTTY